jgi:hypothetical protein
MLASTIAFARPVSVGRSFPDRQGMAPVALGQERGGLAQGIIGTFDPLSLWRPFRFTGALGPRLCSALRFVLLSCRFPRLGS